MGGDAVCFQAGEICVALTNKDRAVRAESLRYTCTVKGLWRALRRNVMGSRPLQKIPVAGET